MRAVSNAVRRASGCRSGEAQVRSCPRSTGVGKTELAKALAQFLFDDERAMIRSTCRSIKSGTP